MAKKMVKQMDGGLNELPKLNVFDRELFEKTTMNDPKLQVEVLGLFSTQLSLVRKALTQTSLDLQDSKFMSHSLRGAASAVGANEIEDLASQWEQMSLDQETLSKRFETAARKFQLATAHYRQMQKAG